MSSQNKSSEKNVPNQYKTLKEIEEFLQIDSKFHFYHLMRANYRMRASKNSIIQGCEIKSVENRVIQSHTRKKMFQQVHDALKMLREEVMNLNEPSSEEEVKKIVQDLEKAFELFEEGKKFRSSLEDAGSFGKVLESIPSGSYEYAMRAEFIERVHPNEVAQITSDYRTSLDLNPNNFFSLLKFGEFFSIRRSYKSGRLYLDKSIAVEPMCHYSYEIRGAVKMSSNRNFKGGINDCNKALTILRDAVTVEDILLEKIAVLSTIRGLAYFKLSHFDTAIKDFTTALEIQKSGPVADIRFYRSDCYVQIERYEEAIIDLSVAIQLGREGARVKRNEVVQKLKNKIMRI